MAFASSVLHRGRRIAAKSIRLGRAVIAELRQPSEVETLMASLPAVASAPGLAGKVVAITGGTQGVGLVVARAFAARGAKVVVNGRREAAVAGAVEALRQPGVEVAGVTADVATAEGAARIVGEAVAAFGGLDVLINNAAVAGAYAPAWEVPVEDLEETVRINLTGPMLCTREAVRCFRERGVAGRVINVSSVVTEANWPKFTFYGTTKAGLEAMTGFFAADLPHAEVVLTALVLPGVRTERKAAADWASTELLPPAESLVPAFEYVATGPANLLHGRVISAARFIREPTGEAQLAGLASVREEILYPELVVDGATIARDPRHVTLLDRAENQHGTSPRALAAISASLADHAPAFYPDERLGALAGALAEEHGLAPGSFAFGPGSWELISRMVGLFAKPGEQVVSSGPGWFGFNLVCQRHGVAQVLVPFDRGETGNQPSHNLEAMRRAITPRTRLVYLISPSNPEGVTLQHREVQEFLADLPPELPVLIDEAYAEYADDPEMVDVPALVRESGRAVIGLRTFSKFHALAGLRVGYAYAQPPLIDFVRRQAHIFTVSHVAEVAAVAALKDHEHRKLVFERSRAAREEMQRGLAERGIGHIRSEAPYVMAEAPHNFEELADGLARQGIVIARFRFHDGRMVMLPVGTSEQNRRILDAIRRPG